MPVEHSPVSLSDRNRDKARVGSQVACEPAPHSSTPQGRRSHQPTRPSEDKTLPVDDLVEGEDLQETDNRAVTDDASQGGKVIGRLDQDMYKPFGSCSRSSSDTSSDAAVCTGGPNNKVCGTEVKEDDMGVQCGTCNRWFHSQCQGITRMAFNALKRHKILSWHCSGCKLGLGQKMRTDTGCQCSTLEAKVDMLNALVKENLKMLERHNDQVTELMKKDNASLREYVEARMEKVEKVMGTHADMINNQERMLEHSFKKMQEDKTTYAEAVKGSADMIEKVAKKMDSIPGQGNGKSSSNTEKAIAGVLDDYLEKEKKKLNVVLHNVPEPPAETYAERVEQDKAKFKEIIRDGMHLNVNATKAYRVGKPNHDKPRLLIVGMENAEVKIDVLKMAPQLRATDEWRNVFITPDLTWKERVEGRRLREELRKRVSEGEQNLIIRRGRIVQKAGEGGQNSHPQQERNDEHQQAQTTQGQHQETPEHVPVREGASAGQQAC